MDCQAIRTILLVETVTHQYPGYGAWTGEPVVHAWDFLLLYESSCQLVRNRASLPLGPNLVVEICHAELSFPISYEIIHMSSPQMIENIQGIVGRRLQGLVL